MEEHIKLMYNFQLPACKQEEITAHLHVPRCARNSRQRVYPKSTIHEHVAHILSGR